MQTFRILQKDTARAEHGNDDDDVDESRQQRRQRVVVGVRIEQRQCESNRETVEEIVIPRQHDHDLQGDLKRGVGVAQRARRRQRPERRNQLDEEHDGAARDVERVGQLVCEERADVRNARGFVVNLERGERPPFVTARQQLDDARREHQAKQQPLHGKLDRQQRC